MYQTVINALDEKCLEWSLQIAFTYRANLQREIILFPFGIYASSPSVSEPVVDVSYVRVKSHLSNCFRGFSESEVLS